MHFFSICCWYFNFRSSNRFAPCFIVVGLHRAEISWKKQCFPSLFNMCPWNNLGYCSAFLQSLVPLLGERIILSGEIAVISGPVVSDNAERSKKMKKDEKGACPLSIRNLFTQGHSGVSILMYWPESRLC